MEDIVGEIGKGFLRGIGYLLAEVYFRTICYWVGWLVCKTITVGHYPTPKRSSNFEEDEDSGFWCSCVGLMTTISLGIYAVLHIA